MNVLEINGSPHENGNTAYALRYALALINKAGIATEYISLADKEIHGCEGCFACESGECVHDDDMRSIIDAMRQCDCLLLASPVYMGLVTGQMKTVVERSLYARTITSLSRFRRRNSLPCWSPHAGLLSDRPPAGHEAG